MLNVTYFGSKQINSLIGDLGFFSFLFHLKQMVGIKIFD